MSEKNKSSYLINIFIVLISISITFIIIEAGTRIYYSQPLFSFIDYRENTLNLYKSGLPIKFHETLGWIPQPGYSSNNNMWGTDVTILKDGIRSNENHLKLESSHSVLAVGDSFTFGDEVSNNETWPAILERLIKRPVLNAGVFAYGTDQSFLRLKLLLAKYKPDTIIFSFIRNDIRRCEYSKCHGFNKPYFVIANNYLNLMNIPVRQVTIKPRTIIKIFGYSYFFHNTMIRLNPAWWLLADNEEDERNENHTGSGMEITCLIFRELENIVKVNKINHAYILVQDTNFQNYVSPDTEIDYVLTCLNKKTFKVIDLRKKLLDLKTNNGFLYNSFFKIRHMTATGNQFVAETVFHSMQVNTN